MQKLNNQQLSKISAGGFSAGLAMAIVAGLTFIAGIIDGYVRPLPCHK